MPLDQQLSEPTVIEKIREPRKLWVLFDPKTKTFVGARWRKPHYSMMYTLGEFDTAFHCDSAYAASQTFSLVSKTEQYCLLSKKEIKRIKVYRVRQRVIILKPEKNSGKPKISKQKASTPVANQKPQSKNKAKRKTKR